VIRPFRHLVSTSRRGAGNATRLGTIANGPASIGLAGGFDQFVEFAPDAIVGVGAAGQIVLANAQTEALFGYARAELLGQAVEVLVPERFRGAHSGHRSGYFGDPRTRPMGAKLELFGRRRDGSEFPAEISLSSIETDGGVLAIAAVRDVSEREQARRQFEQFLEFAPDAIVGVGRSGHILLANAQTEALFGYARDELLGQAVEVLVPERWHDVHPRHRGGYFSDPRTRPMGAQLELFGRRRDGSEFPAEISLSSIETDDGLLAIAAIRDITERRALEAQLEQARRLESAREKEVLETQLNQLRRLESVGQLAGGIAHDFNNLLGVILNYAAFVAESIDDGSPVLEDVDEIRRAAERGAALTRQLLIFSRREVVRPQVLDISQVVGELDKLLRRALGEHISLTTQFAPDLWAVEVDLGQFEQVLVNLAVNARDAMPNGGRLILETANVELDATYREIEHEVVPGRYVRLTVSDTGVGMDPEVAKRAFEPFFSTKPRGQGTGLGLTTVYGIVTEAGGNLKHLLRARRRDHRQGPPAGQRERAGATRARQARPAGGARRDGARRRGRRRRAPPHRAHPLRRRLRRADRRRRRRRAGDLRPPRAADRPSPHRRRHARGARSRGRPSRDGDSPRRQGALHVRLHPPGDRRRRPCARRGHRLRREALQRRDPADQRPRGSRRGCDLLARRLRERREQIRVVDVGGGAQRRGLLGRVDGLRPAGEVYASLREALSLPEPAL
jgi:PAS domain S-box-containing protein